VSDLLNPELLSAVDALSGQAFNGDIWRVTWTGRNPLVGSVGGGRWSPVGRFEVLYTSLKADGAMAEVYYHLSRAPVMSSSHMRLNRLNVSLDNALVLDVTQLKTLGVNDPLASRVDYELTQAVGEAAYMMDYQGLIVPSARWECNNLLLFIERIDLNEHIELLKESDINWPAWREKL